MDCPFQADSQDKNDLIHQAIAKRQRLRMVYENQGLITVEPCLLGQLNGEDTLLCWQLVPPMTYGKNWRLLLLGSMSALQVLN